MVDVLVVGAGPVGLTMAAELARHGAACRIVDRLPAPTSYCKALGVTPRTLEVWEDMGVVRPMIDAGLWLHGFRLMVNGQVVKEAPAGLPDFPFGFPLGLPQYETERVLAEHLARFGLAPERGMSVTALAPTEDGVDVRLDHADGRTERTRFSYVVGSDGAHSAVRKAMDVGFPGEAYPFDFMLGDVAVDWDVPRGVSVRGVKLVDGEMAGFFVAVPLPDRGRYRLSMFAPGAMEAMAAGGQAASTSDAHGIQSEREQPALAALQAALDDVTTGLTLSDLRWSSIFRIGMRIADSYRRGRIFIAGDAAHIHPPTGGQGMNTGIQDAYNLAWKLALVVRGQAPDSLLDSYDAERRPVGQDVLRRTIAETEAFSRGQAGGKRGGDTRLEDSQLLVNYRDSAWVGQDRTDPAAAGSPAAGDRAPDANGLRRNGLGMPLRLFDLLRGTEHVLLVKVGDLAAAETAAAMAARLAARYGGHLRIYAIASAGQAPADLPGLPVIEDADGRFAAAYGGPSTALWLVRPDGYLGFRSAERDEAALLRHLEKVLLAG